MLMFCAAGNSELTTDSNDHLQGLGKSSVRPSHTQEGPQDPTAPIEQQGKTSPSLQVPDF